MNLLKSGRLPKQRTGTVVEMICKRGNASDLKYIYERSLSPDGYTGELRLKSLGYLAEAAVTRKVKPNGDLSGLGQLIQPGQQDQNPAERIAAVRLVGLWKVESLAGKLREIALDEKADFELRKSAIGGIVRIGGRTGLQTVSQLTEPKYPQPVRYLAVAGMTSLDLRKAADAAARVLSEGTSNDDPAQMLAAFFNRRAGADSLAAALSKGKLPQDVAKRALRYMYSVGRSDAALSDSLSKAAGISTVAKPLSKEEIKLLSDEVVEKGDPDRGELVFRRADLSCMKCHSVSKAGGTVGPDLSAVGSSSPVDYVVNSILFPNQAIKEQYKTTIVVTVEGKVFNGIVVDKNDDRIVLKGADGTETVIPTDDIEEQEAGKSLMPQGLAKFLTHQELIDLARFLSELGKPGEYTIRTTPTIQRWRVLKRVPSELALAVPDAEMFRQKVLQTNPMQWSPAYGKVAGMLPLDELTRKSGENVLFLQGEVQVTVAGDVGIRINSWAGTHLWMDDQPVQAKEPIITGLARGRHKITLRVDITKREAKELKVEVLKTEGSTAEFVVVGGS